MEKEKNNTNAAEDNTNKSFAAKANPTYLAEFWRALSHRQYSIKALVVGPHVLIDILIFEGKTKEGPLERIESQRQTVFGAFAKLGR